MSDHRWDFVRNEQFWDGHCRIITSANSAINQSNLEDNISKPGKTVRASDDWFQFDFLSMGAKVARFSLNQPQSTIERT